MTPIYVAYWVARAHARTRGEGAITEQTDREAVRPGGAFTEAAAFDVAADWMALIDADCVIRRVNRTMADGLGMPADDIVGRPCHEVLHETAAPVPNCPHLRLLRDGGEPRRDVVEVAGRGMFEVACTPLVDDGGTLVGSVHTMHNITRRVHVEIHAQEHAHYLQQVLDAIPTPIYHKDDEGRYVVVNDAFARAADRPREQIIGRTAHDVFPDDIAADYAHHDRALLENGGRDSRVALGWDARLGTRRVELHRSVYADLNGLPAGIVGVEFDVTEREEGEAALLRTQQELVRAQEIGLMGSWEWDVASDSLRWSDELYRVWGVDRETFTLSLASTTKLIHPEDRRLNRSLHAQLANGVEKGTIDFRIIRPGGEIRHLHQTLEVEHDAGGTVVRAFGIMQDVTDMVETREALRRRENLLRGLFDVMPSGCVVCDVTSDGRSARDYVMTDVNQTALRAHGRHKEELVGQGLDTLWPSAASNGLLETAWRVWRTGDPEQMIVKEHDGERLLSWQRHSLFRLASGELVDIFTDLTAEKLVEEARRSSEAEMHAIFDLAGIPMIVMDTRGGFRRWNRAAQKALGYPPEDLRRMTARDVTVPTERVEMLRRLSHALDRKGAPYRLERRVLTADGVTRWFDLSVTPVLGADGEVSALIAAGTDVTESHLAKDALVASQEQLRDALDSTVASMGAIVAIRDPYTAGHERRVASLVVAIAEELGLPQDAVAGLQHAASVHDVGKIAIPAEILTVPRRLSEWELSLIQTHPEIGHDVLSSIAFDQPVAATVLQHHERLDGTGYPAHLRGDAISLTARILAVADVIEAMASNRPYRPALGVEAALREIQEGAGSLYDEKVVAACIRVVRNGVVDLDEPAV